MSVSCVYCVLSGRGLCEGPITLPEISFQNVCVFDGDLETYTTKNPATTRAVEA